MIGVVGKDPFDAVLSQRWQHRHLLCGPVRIDTEVEDLRAVDVRVGGDRRHVQALVRGALLAVGAPRVELSIVVCVYDMKKLLFYGNILSIQAIQANQAKSG